MKHILSLIATALIVVGCAATGHRFDLSKTSEIKRGVTTQAELEEWFGKPWSSKSKSGGSREVVWQYTKAAMAVGITEQQVLTAYVDQRGIVTDFKTQETARP